MTTTIARAPLVDALRAVRAVVANNATLPVLANVALESANGTLTLTATNLEQYAKRTLPYSGDDLPAVTVPAKAFSDFVAGFSGDSVQLALDGTRLRLQAGRQRASLAVIDRDEYPIFQPIRDAATFTLTREELERVAARVVPFAASDIARPILTGVHVHGDGAATRFAAADNYRIGILSVDGRAEVDAVIPASAFALATKVLIGDEVSVSVNQSQALFASSTGLLSTRLIDGQYPNIDPILPKQYGTTVLVTRDEYAQGVKLAALATALVVKFEEREDGLRVYASDYDRDFDTTLEANFGVGEHEPVRFAVNQKFANAIASAFSESSEVEIGYNTSLSPIGFRDPDDASFVAVLMPVRTAVTA